MKSFKEILERSLKLLDYYQIRIECINQYQDLVIINIINEIEYYLVFVSIKNYSYCGEYRFETMVKLESFLLKNLTKRRVKILETAAGHLNYNSFYFDKNNFLQFAFRNKLKDGVIHINYIYYKSNLDIDYLYSEYESYLNMVKGSNKNNYLIKEEIPKRLLFERRLKIDSILARISKREDTER